MSFYLKRTLSLIMIIFNLSPLVVVWVRQLIAGIFRLLC